MYQRCMYQSNTVYFSLEQSNKSDLKVKEIILTLSSVYSGNFVEIEIYMPTYRNLLICENLFIPIWTLRNRRGNG